MIDIAQSGAIEIKKKNARSDAIGGLLGYVSGLGWPVFVWPFVAISRHLVVWQAVAYLVVLTGLHVAFCYRLARVALLIGDDGLVVRNILRSWRVGWPQVAEFVDGGDGSQWALTVLLVDGRAVTCAATAGIPLCDPPTVRVLREVAARYGVRADLGGVAAPRPRAWEDSAAAARWCKARLGNWLLVTAVAIAWLVPVSLWNGSRHNYDYGPVFLPFAYAVVIAAAAAAFAGGRLHEVVREAASRDYEVAEGSWFSVPLGRDRHAVGVIARKQLRGNLVLAYFFAPFDSPRPALDQLADLRPVGALRVGLVAATAIRDGGPARRGSWPLLGRASNWERSAWPVPVFARTDPKANQSFRVYCDDQLRLVGEDLEPADPGATKGLPAWALASKESVVADLNMRLKA